MKHMIANGAGGYKPSSLVSSICARGRGVFVPVCCFVSGEHCSDPRFIRIDIHNPSCKRHSHNLDIIKQYLELRLFLPLLEKGGTQLIKTHTELGQKIKIHPTG